MYNMQCIIKFIMYVYLIAKCTCEYIFLKNCKMEDLLTGLLTSCLHLFQDGKMLVWDAFTTNKVHLLHIDL